MREPTMNPIIDLKHAQLKYNFNNQKEVLAYVNMQDIPTIGEVNDFACLSMNTEGNYVLTFMNEHEVTKIMSKDNNTYLAYVSPDHYIVAKDSYQEYCLKFHLQQEFQSNKEINSKKEAMIDTFFNKINESIVAGTFQVIKTLNMDSLIYDVIVGSAMRIAVAIDETKLNPHEKVIFQGLYESLNTFLSSDDKIRFFTRVWPIIALQRNAQQLEKLTFLENLINK